MGERGWYGLSWRMGGSQGSEGEGGWGWDGWRGWYRVLGWERLGCVDVGGGGGGGGPLD